MPEALTKAQAKFLWNNGTHAKAHGYRQKLLDALPEAKAALAEQPQ